MSVLVACGRGNADRAAPISGEQRAQILAALEQFRTLLNQSPCERVLDLAVDRLRTSDQSRDWVEKCRHIRVTLGDWRSFEADYWYRSGNNAIAVEGTAGFTKGGGVIQVVWDLQSASPRMAFFFLRSKEDQVDFPELPSLHHLVDPPTKEGRKRMESTG